MVSDIKCLGPPASRTFTTSRVLQKKSSASKKSARHSPEINGSKQSEHVPNNKATVNRDKEVDPYDYSELEAGIAKAIARLKDALAKTRDAGRVSAGMIESLPVELNVKGGGAHGESPHKERLRVGDIASVVPKGGRMMQVFCGEETVRPRECSCVTLLLTRFALQHIKPISNAIKASPHSLVPEPDKQNPMLLLIPIPPATAETRKQAAAEAKKVMERASLEVRTARGDAQKKFRKMELQKTVVVDELRKAHKGMEDVVKKGQDEVKRVYEAALKTLEG